MAAGLTASGCTVVLPVHLGVAASRHNRAAAREEARTGTAAPRQSVANRVVVGIFGGLAIDALLATAALLILIDNVETH